MLMTLRLSYAPASEKSWGEKEGKKRIYTLTNLDIRKKENKSDGKEIEE